MSTKSNHAFPSLNGKTLDDGPIWEGFFSSHFSLSNQSLFSFSNSRPKLCLSLTRGLDGARARRFPTKSSSHNISETNGKKESTRRKLLSGIPRLWGMNSKYFLTLWQFGEQKKILSCKTHYNGVQFGPI